MSKHVINLFVLFLVGNLLVACGAPTATSVSEAPTATLTAAPPTATPTSIPSPTPVPTIDMDATSTAITEGVFATMTAAVPTSTDTPTPTDTVIPTDTPIPPSPTPTPTPAPPTLTPTPIPTIDADPTVYDNFNNPANDGSFNQNQWTPFNLHPSSGLVVQEDGVLKVTFHGRPGDATGLIARKYNDFQLTAPTFFEAKMMANYVQDGNFVLLRLYSDLSSDDFTDCIYEVRNTDVSVHCNYNYSRREDLYITESRIKTDFGTWHTARIEVDPTTMTFTYFADGQVIGSHVSANAEALKAARFRFEIGVWGPSSEPFTGYIDDVRIGQIGQ